MRLSIFCSDSIYRRNCRKVFPREKIIETLKFDKKFEGGNVRFVVTPRIGSARLATDVTMQDIREAIDGL